jgi:uncharacterized BrkB/YihY/UPF0761 family membrane protein
MLITRLKKAWKEVVLMGLWLVSIVGSFIIPMPSWSASELTSGYYLKFIIVIASTLGLFLILYSLRNSKIKKWRFLSILFFSLFILSITTYSYLREELTLPYENKDIIIGGDRVENDPLTKLEKKNGGTIEKNEILKHFQGKSERVWTEKSIKLNRLKLTSMFMFSYIITTCFIISFSNLIILYKQKYKK